MLTQSKFASEGLPGRRTIGSADGLIACAPALNE